MFCLLFPLESVFLQISFGLERTYPFGGDVGINQEYQSLRLYGEPKQCQSACGSNSDTCHCSGASTLRVCRFRELPLYQ